MSISSLKDYLILVGYGGHASSVADSIDTAGKYIIYGYTDLKQDLNSSLDWLGTDDLLPKIKEQGINYAAIGVGFVGNTDRDNIMIGKRDRLFMFLKKCGYNLPPIIDATATVSSSAYMDEGIFIGKGAIVNAGTFLGKVSIVNTGTIIEHGVTVGDYSHVAGGCVVCGGVDICDHVFVGANTTIIQGVKVGSHSLIGAGSVILKDVPEGAKVYGVWNRA